LLSVNREGSGGFTVGHGVRGEPEEDVEAFPPSVPVKFRQGVVLEQIRLTKFEFVDLSHTCKCHTLIRINTS
jgi:hypothetical protein